MERQPTESFEQQWLFVWAKEMAESIPELAMLYAVPNGATTSRQEGSRLKAEGLKAGVPDIVLPVARVLDGRLYTHLYIELKRRDGIPSDLSDRQKWWLERLTREGAYATWCRGNHEAQETILNYLAGERPDLEKKQ